MAALLPDDLLHMVCGSLWEQRDFDTLYHCACAGKQLAVPALASLYRIHDVAPVTTRSEDMDIPTQGKAKGTYDANLKGQERATMKWANMWRSIMLSSLGLTLFPYAHYIRTLAFGDLQEMFEDSKFNAKMSSAFFGGDLQKYKVETRIPGAASKGKVRLDSNGTANAFAEVIMQRTPVLEELSGTLVSEVLAKCIPSIPNLQRLSVFKGEALEGMGDLLRKHCPLLTILKFYNWVDPNADVKFAAMLNELRPHSLESFETFGISHISGHSFSALSRHSETLTELHLHSIHNGAMLELGNLRECTKLRSLVLAESTPMRDLEVESKECFRETVAWLRNCKSLKALTINNFISGTALATPVLSENKIELTRLSISAYMMSQNKDVHQALPLQPTLQYLSLKGEGSDDFVEVKILVDSLIKLPSLKELSLREISNDFSDQDIIKLAKNLPKLEELWISGTAISDAIWPHIGALPWLRRLELSADTRFTANGILDFVTNLEEGNKGFSLNVMMQEMTSDITEEEQLVIRDLLRERLDGRFDFQLIRDPEIEGDFSDSGSD